MAAQRHDPHESEKGYRRQGDLIRARKLGHTSLSAAMKLELNLYARSRSPRSAACTTFSVSIVS